MSELWEYGKMVKLQDNAAMVGEFSLPIQFPIQYFPCIEFQFEPKTILLFFILYAYCTLIKIH